MGVLFSFIVSLMTAIIWVSLLSMALAMAVTFKLPK